MIGEITPVTLKVINVSLDDVLLLTSTVAEAAKAVPSKAVESDKESIN